jgi:glycosyltransferase involved in cell wall biosynthesis
MVIQRLVVAAPEGWKSPSAHYRFGPIARSGLWNVDVVATGTFPKSEHVNGLLELAGADAVLVLQRVLPRRRDIDRLRDGFRYLVFDIDDAIYTVPPGMPSSWLAKSPKRLARMLVRGSRYASSRKRPLERTLERVDACVVGNSILGEFAQRHAECVVEIPTTVTPLREPPAIKPEPPVLVWHGMLGNLQYLALARNALQTLARRFDFRLRIIASATWADAPMPVEFVPWSHDAQHQGLLRASVGLAPMGDDRWTRGKCAYRSVQYGGYGLATVASPVGITDKVVVHGKTGFLARSTEEWLDGLGTLLTDPGLAAQMGAAALRHIQEHYSDELAIARWRALIASLNST